MRRRAFIAGLGSAAVWPVAAEAQQSGVPEIGVLQIGAPASYDLAGFRQGLKETGYAEGKNLKIAYRWSNDDPDRMPELAADLVRRRVRVIATIASSIAAQAAKSATSEIPIVFGYGLNPVDQGLVASLNHPGGNVTGITSMASELFGKQLGILHELLPQARRFGVLTYSRSPQFKSVVKETEAAGSVLGQTVEVFSASGDSEVDAVFRRLGDQKEVQGLLVTNDSYFPRSSRSAS
jgi:putative tryptophan/tyrosine transport system substrate-binding protein